NSTKSRAKHHGPYRITSIAVAQRLHATGVRLRTRLIGSKTTAAKVRPLNSSKAIKMVSTLRCGLNEILEVCYFKMLY
ncbi:hypothetical protein V1514DRAFT_279275, partial [Lipomyces japonicus]|uniref:uncharacterized protein n=1 Tax=Lipomyces japonicus TaxID=56871 RepID=UPI0034CDA808